jgi:fatty acid desaturase
MSTTPGPTRRRAILVCALAALAALACGGLVFLAVLAPAPPTLVPLIVLACVTCAVIAARHLPPCIAVLRDARWALAELRRDLDRFPQTEHPLGL